ncbi:MAG: DNA recombination protein RmuC [Rhodospirillales bacterium]|nr:DNA recombination protein RmuC [Rhodospirillales bacterium]
MLLRQSASVQRLRLLAEQALAGQRAEAESLRVALTAAERGLSAAQATTFGQLRGELTGAIEALRAGQAARLAEIQGGLATRLHEAAAAQAAAAGQLRTEVGAAIADSRAALDLRLRELREGNEAKLAEIQKTVNEQLHEAVEKQMSASFTRVTEQFAQVQKAMGEMQAVGAQIGDLKRLFGNVKTRGGWGEGQVRAMLDDILPEGAYDTNWKPRATSDDAVEFAVIMPGRGEDRPRLPIDAKFPVEDYERILTAIELGDADAEKLARRALERRVRTEAQKMQEKYIAPPATVEFAVMYVPTDGIYTEIARIDGLIDDLGRQHRVLVLGPSLFPALLHTIFLGHMTLALEQKAHEVSQLLGATKAEMQKMDKVLETLGKQAATFSNTIEKARVRTRMVDRKLRGITAADTETTARLLGSVEDGLAEEEEEEAG